MKSQIAKNKDDFIDSCVKEYITKNKSKLVSGKKADEAFEDVQSSLNVDNAFIYETKEFDGIPALYMRSSKSKTLVLVYFAIKDEARHIEFKPEELIDMCSCSKGDICEKEDKSVNMELINETVDRLYKKAALCETVEEAEVYVQKAEELQKAIDEIPEEDPIEDDEYPDETSGGPGEKIDQEEIKELVGNDPIALKLLNIDTQSVTIDA